MQKEIFEQPESVVNTMRGRVNFTTEKGNSLCTHMFIYVCRHKFMYIVFGLWTCSTYAYKSYNIKKTSCFKLCIYISLQFTRSFIINYSYLLIPFTITTKTLCIHLNASISIHELVVFKPLFKGFSIQRTWESWFTNWSYCHFIRTHFYKKTHID